MRERADDRVSMVVERPRVSEARFLAMCRALAAAQSHSAGLRSVAYGASGSGGVREVTADERAIDAGAVGRGRRAWLRVTTTSGEARAALLWLVTYAHVGDLRALAALYGEHAAPLALRTPREVAALRLRAVEGDLRAAETALAKATPRSQRRVGSPQADALRLAVEGQRQRRADAQARVDATTAAVTAWGLDAMAVALDAWGEADEGERAA